MNTPKKSSGNVRPRAGTRGVSQPAADRRSAEEQLSGLIKKFSPNDAQLVAAVRRSLKKRLPTAHEVGYEYRDCFVISVSPSVHGYEGVLAIRGSAEGVRLYFQRGKDLPDPEKLLQGKSMTRFVDVESVSTLTLPAVAALISEAISRTPIPFAADGKGSLAIRLTTASKKPKSGSMTKKVSSKKKSG